MRRSHFKMVEFYSMYFDMQMPIDKFMRELTTNIFGKNLDHTHHILSKTADLVHNHIREGIEPEKDTVPFWLCKEINSFANALEIQNRREVHQGGVNFFFTCLHTLEYEMIQFGESLQLIDEKYPGFSKCYKTVRSRVVADLCVIAVQYISPSTTDVHPENHDHNKENHDPESDTATQDPQKNPPDTPTSGQIKVKSNLLI